MIIDSTLCKDVFQIQKKGISKFETKNQKQSTIRSYMI